MKQVKLSDIAELRLSIPFFCFESATLRHHISSINDDGFVIDSGHRCGLYFTQDTDVYISDANYRKYFKGRVKCLENNVSLI